MTFTKIKSVILVLVPFIAIIAIILRLMHIISNGAFIWIGVVLGLIASFSSDPSKTEEKPISDLKEHINPVKKRQNLVMGCVKIIGGFYLVVLILSFLGQF